MSPSSLSGCRAARQPGKRPSGSGWQKPLSHPHPGSSRVTPSWGLATRHPTAYNRSDRYGVCLHDTPLRNGTDVRACFAEWGVVHLFHSKKRAILHVVRQTNSMLICLSQSLLLSLSRMMSTLPACFSSMHCCHLASIRLHALLASSVGSRVRCCPCLAGTPDLDAIDDKVMMRLQCHMLSLSWVSVDCCVLARRSPYDRTPGSTWYLFRRTCHRGRGHQPGRRHRRGRCRGRACPDDHCW